MASSYTYSKYMGCKVKPQRVQRDGGAIDRAIAPNVPAWLRVWVQNNFGRALLLPSREQNINSMCAAVQHNFRRTLLVPSREKNISSLGAAVQHNFRRTRLVPSWEENIKRISIALAPRYSQARRQDKIPEFAK